MREAAAEDADQPQAELVAKPEDFFVIGFDELAPKLRMMAGRKVANRAHASAGVVSRVKQGHRGACPGEFMGCGQSGKSGPGNDDASAAHEGVPQQPQCHEPIIGT